LLFNLVGNAIKYNRDGGRVYVLGRPASTEGSYVLEVRDTGIGIAKEQLPRLFQPFDKGATADPDSYGLGLSIAHTIAELHGIRIEVNSIEGLGSSFQLLFPPVPRP
jgi:signal transduction histidine kinase